MEQYDLLDAVQPSDGWFAILSIKSGGVRQFLVQTREEADELIAKGVKHGRDVYYGVAKFASSRGRTKNDVQALKAFWLDLDCGDNKPYPAKADALDALKSFCKVTNLPRPTLVDSGRGIHVYWPLTNAIERGEWEPVAAALRNLCAQHGLRIDPSVFEVARVLRVPGTFNFKDDPPAPVEVLMAGNAVEYEWFRQLVGSPPKVLSTPARSFGGGAKRTPSALTAAITEDRVSNFAKIMRRSANGTGCPQLLSCYTERATLEEPRWFDALSIAKFCVDGDSAIHKLSDGHPDYDPEATKDKLRHILGPHTCDVFERNNPSGCIGCDHRGSIRSPIMLGREVAETPPPDPEEQVDEGQQSQSKGSYPEPFFRGASGGIWRRGVGDEDEPLHVYEHDLFIIKRMRDPVLGDVVLMQLHLPKDGVAEFVVPNIKIADKNELRKALASQGILCSNKKFDLLSDYITTAIRELQFKRKAELMRLQFGWADNDTKFIVGGREVSVTGDTHSPPSSTTATLASYLAPAGSFERWKDVFSLLGRPGLEMHAFAVMTAFGAPLLRFTGQKGAIINLIHPNSGTGKTTLLQLCNSVWGLPDKLCATKQDTLNAKIQRLGIMNNLPFTIDEITNMSPGDFSELAYSMSQGRGKDRMKQSANEMRVNLTSWQTISLCSSNASFYEKMGLLKSRAEGEMMRLMEYSIGYSDAIEPAVAKEMFDHVLLENYGHAGPIFARYIVEEQDEVRDAVLSIRKKVDKEARISQAERFWSAMVAANIAGGLIAKQLGLIDWDIKRIYERVLQEIVSMREDVKPIVSNATGVVGDYINRHIQNVLVVNKKLDVRTKRLPFPTVEPKGELLIRFEPDVKRLYLTVSAFKKDCAENQTNYRGVLRELELMGVLVDTRVKRMSKGMKLVTPPVYALELNTDNPEFGSMEDLIPKQEDKVEEEVDDGGGG